MDTALENFSEVRDIVAYLWGKVLDNPAEAVDVATARLAQVDGIDRADCARAELLAIRGAARREGGDPDECGHDLDSAEASCACSDCLPQILRQRALLATVQGEHGDARELIERAIVLCALTGPVSFLYSLHLSRAIVLHYSGDHFEVLASVRVASEGITPKDGIPWVVLIHRHAGCLMAIGQWSEAWQVLEDAAPNLEHVNGAGARAVKRFIRWARALVGVQLGKISHASARVRIRRIVREFKSTGILNIAAVLADSALLGIDVTKGALSVLSELPDGTPEELRAKLDALANLEPGDDVRSPALELRELFPSAPPLPPSLKESE